MSDCSSDRDGVAAKLSNGESCIEIRGKVVLVVGASSGIGRAVAIRLAGRGALIAATARRADRLALLASQIANTDGQCHVFPADATDAGERALHWRLANSGYEFGEIRDRVRMEHVTMFLRESNIPIGSVAARVGFSGSRVLTSQVE
ncbi:SDR family NAD(P)-dependent oxidoreductase [Nocardia sp. NPDC006982]|uniref:SDR family NAD(P)-dependent oxidoreductase n=1 Tax=Nocardia sp. NPDC006982 TaxID=3364307 RepID=UPI0036CAF07B